MSRSIWVIFFMGIIATVAVCFGMMVFLGQFQEVPAAEWVKLAEATTAEFKLEKVAVRVNLLASPSALQINYLTKADTKFNTSVALVSL